mmetsp:Transcript_61223/g.168017  ORF Transcript_61223/g.168017 Transcript_61223/m.168017 type:complete len:126 (-) Transcript_61223:704-1081(-)
MGCDRAHASTIMQTGASDNGWGNKCSPKAHTTGHQMASPQRLNESANIGSHTAAARASATATISARRRLLRHRGLPVDSFGDACHHNLLRHPDASASAECSMSRAALSSGDKGASVQKSTTGPPD